MILVAGITGNRFTSVMLLECTQHLFILEEMITYCSITSKTVRWNELSPLVGYVELSYNFS